MSNALLSILGSDHSYTTSIKLDGARPSEYLEIVSGWCKGQLISECILDFFKYSKKTNEKFDKFTAAQNLKSGHIIK